MSATPSWQQVPEPGHYINWTATNADGSLNSAATYKEDTTADFGVYVWDNTGTLLGSDIVSNAYCGVFWTALPATGAYLASGGWMSKTANPDGGYLYTGFLRAFSIGSGGLTTLLDQSTLSRVNSIVFSRDGGWLAAASGDSGGRDNTLWLYQLQGDAYVLTSSIQFPSSAGSVAMSQDGSWVVTGAGDTVYLYQNVGGALTLAGSWTQSTSRPRGLSGSWTPYIQFVSMNPAGTYFAACSSSGDFWAFETSSFAASGPLWDYYAGDTNVYGVAISSDGASVIASANTKQILRVDTVASPSSPSGYTGNLVWSFPTIADPSPSVTVDWMSQFVTAADGYPENTPGHYYLLDFATGGQVWDFTTGNVSWPCVVSGEGNSVFGGSDDSSVSYFQTGGGPAAT